MTASFMSPSHNLHTSSGGISTTSPSPLAALFCVCGMRTFLQLGGEGEKDVYQRPIGKDCCENGFQKDCSGRFFPIAAATPSHQFVCPHILCWHTNLQQELAKHESGSRVIWCFAPKLTSILTCQRHLSRLHNSNNTKVGAGTGG